jgi:hypothetical protein
MPGALREDALRVALTRDGAIYFREHRIALEDLPNEIREGLRSGAERKVYIAVDARAKFGETCPLFWIRFGLPEWKRSHFSQNRTRPRLSSSQLTPIKPQAHLLQF